MAHNTATETGTATSGADLWSKLKTFLTADADLVSAGENWTQVWSDSSDEIVLEGPGMSGTDSVLIGMKYIEDVGAASAEIQLSGMQGYLSSATSFDNHVNNQTEYSRLLFSENLSMPYWFYATGRRFVVVVKVSTNYESCYAGLFLPYCLPSEYPLPLFVGAVAREGDDADDWRSTDEDHLTFTLGNGYYLDPSGLWNRCVYGGINDGESGVSPFSVSPWRDSWRPSGWEIYRTEHFGYRTISENIISSYGGDYSLINKTLVRYFDTGGVLIGDLDGVYHVPGVGMSAETAITIGADSATVFQNAFRTSKQNYFGVID